LIYVKYGKRPSIGIIGKFPQNPQAKSGGWLENGAEIVKYSSINSCDDR